MVPFVLDTTLFAFDIQFCAVRHHCTLVTIFLLLWVALNSKNFQFMGFKAALEIGIDESAPFD